MEKGNRAQIGEKRSEIPANPRASDREGPMLLRAPVNSVPGSMRLNHITLPATDVEVSAGFYRRLGLTQIVANYPDYARLLSPEGDVTVSLQRDDRPGQASIHFEVDDVDGVIADLKEAGLEIESEPVDRPWLWREATLLDPDGTRIFVYHAGEMRLDPPWRLR